MSATNGGGQDQAADPAPLSGAAADLPRPRTALGRWWLDAPLRTKGTVVLALPMLCLVAAGLSNLVLTQQLDDLVSSTTSTHAALTTLQADEAEITDAETAVRGYAATGDPVFLAQYQAAARALDPLLGRGAPMPGLSATDTGRVRALGQRAMAILGSVQAGVADHLLAGGVLDRQLLAGRSADNRLRATITSLQVAERTTLTTEEAQVSSEEALVRGIDLGALLVGVVAGLWAMHLFLAGVARRVGAVQANTERFVRGEPRLPLVASADEIGQFQQVLIDAADLLRQRQQEFQRARDAAMAATRAKDEFLSRMSHELRTPLTAVLGFGQLLQLEDLAPDDADSVDHIVEAGRHLLALINDVLDIARIETGHLAFSLEPVLVDDVVAESVALMGPLADARQLEVASDLGEDLVVRADRQRLKQVLLNLVSNAIKYNRPGGRIDVVARAGDDGVVVVEVSDTGVGIPEASLGRLFEPFDRLGAETSPVEGTGVGLSLSKALAEAMGGTITATSHYGRGSTFTLTLPAAQVPLPLPHLAPAAGPASPAVADGVVLYAEDNLATLHVMEHVFSHRAERLEVAGQGRLVLDLARRLQPRLVIVDLHLPDMSGEEVLAQLKADPETAAIPVVVLTADSRPGQLERLVARGAAAYVTKPLDIPELLDLLDANPTAGVGGAPQVPGPSKTSAK